MPCRTPRTQSVAPGTRAWPWEPEGTRRGRPASGAGGRQGGVGGDAGASAPLVGTPGCSFCSSHRADGCSPVRPQIAGFAPRTASPVALPEPPRGRASPRGSPAQPAAGGLGGLLREPRASASEDLAAPRVGHRAQAGAVLRTTCCVTGAHGGLYPWCDGGGGGLWPRGPVSPWDGLPLESASGQRPTAVSRPPWTHHRSTQAPLRPSPQHAGPPPPITAPTWCPCVCSPAQSITTASSGVAAHPRCPTST